MGLFDSTSTIRFEPAFYTAVGDIAAAIRNLTTIGIRIMNDLTNLQAKLRSMTACARPASVVLVSLALASSASKNSGDVQAGIDALADQAQRILDAQTAAEDAADDHLPTP